MLVAGARADAPADVPILNIVVSGSFSELAATDSKAISGFGATKDEIDRNRQYYLSKKGAVDPVFAHERRMAKDLEEKAQVRGWKNVRTVVLRGDSPAEIQKEIQEKVTAVYGEAFRIGGMEIDAHGGAGAGEKGTAPESSVLWTKQKKSQVNLLDKAAVRATFGAFQGRYADGASFYLNSCNLLSPEYAKGRRFPMSDEQRSAILYRALTAFDPEFGRSKEGSLFLNQNGGTTPVEVSSAGGIDPKRVDAELFREIKPQLLKQRDSADPWVQLPPRLLKPVKNPETGRLEDLGYSIQLLKAREGEVAGEAVVRRQLAAHYRDAVSQTFGRVLPVRLRRDAVGGYDSLLKPRSLQELNITGTGKEAQPLFDPARE